MKPAWPVITRILWPERASLFIIIGGAAGIVGDMANFFLEIISPLALIIIFGSVAAASTLLCFQRAMLVDAANEQDVEAVVHCGVCDAMRFGLFAAASFVVLLFVGQGQSATEKIAETLGLIHEDVKQISQDVSNINENVEQIGDVVQSQKIISNPKSAADFFTNAWIYSHIHRNPQKALDALDEMYKRFSPNKMDAAELYYNTARQIKGREELMATMEKYSEDQSDATLLVIAGRNATTSEESDRLYARAREMDPDQPFAYWDIMRFTATVSSTGIGPSEQKAMAQKQVADIENFVERIGKKPASHYFFLPQYQPDHEMVARQTQANMQKNVEAYEGMEKKMNELKQR
jgi:hypothetical protein